MNRNIFIMIPLLMLFSMVHAVNPVIIDNSAEALQIGPYLEILEDKGGQLTLADIQSNEYSDKFISGKPRNILNYGFNSSTYWFRFKVKNITSESSWILVHKYPLIDVLNLYQPNDDGSYSEYKAGDTIPLADRSIKYKENVFILNNVSLNADKYVYVKAGGGSSLIIQLVIYSTKKYIETNHVMEFVFGIFFGMIIIMFITNGILCVSLRSNVYFYYVILILMWFINRFIYYGYSYEYINPVVAAFYDTSTALVGLFMVMFTRVFLSLKNTHPKWNNTLRVLEIMFFITFLLTFIIPYKISVQIIMIETLIGTIIILISGVYSYYKGNKVARYFNIAFALFLIGSILSILSAFAVIPANIFTRESLSIGTITMLVFLSLALGERINIMREQEIQSREEAKRVKKEEALTVQQEKMAILGDITASVAHEINTPLLALTLGKNKIEKYVNKLRERVSISPKETDISFVNAHEKFPKNMVSITNGLDTIRQQIINMKSFIKFQDSTTDFDINEEIETTFSIMNFTLLSYMDVEKELEPSLPRIAGNASQINQLFMSMIKNASEAKKTDDAKGMIKFKTYKSEDKIILEISDNGMGIDSEVIDKIFDDRFSTKPGHRGMGLSICKDLLKELNAKIEVKSKIGEGTTFIIILPAMKTEGEVG